MKMMVLWQNKKSSDTMWQGLKIEYPSFDVLLCELMYHFQQK